MRRVKRGQGIRFLDEQVETASYNTLLAVYSHLILVENKDDITTVLFLFQEYHYKEYQRIYSLLNKNIHQDASKILEELIELYKSSFNSKEFMAPSDILEEFHYSKTFNKLIQKTSCFYCIKLK